MKPEERINISLIGLHSTEVRRLRSVIDTALRNVQIRARYRELRGRMPAGDAKSALAGEYNLSEDAIHSVLWPRS